MTEKEKARELVEKFKPFVRGDDNSLAESFNAKHCARIAVDEKLSILEELHQELMYDNYSEKIIRKEIIHFEKVKQEIEKL